MFLTLQPLGDGGDVVDGVVNEGHVRRQRELDQYGTRDTISDGGHHILTDLHTSQPAQFTQHVRYIRSASTTSLVLIGSHQPHMYAALPRRSRHG